MAYIPQMISENSLTAFIDGKPYHSDKSHPNFAKLVEALRKNDAKTFLSMIDIPKIINHKCNGEVTVKDGVVYYNNEVCHHVCAEHIVKLISQGLPHQPMLNFMKKLFANPSRRAITEFYNWCMHHGMPITEDGDVLGYKAIKRDWHDWHTGKVFNGIGTQVPPMLRNTVDDNWGVACSQGYHVGALSYVRHFHWNEGRMVIVKFNPTDVVTVPSNETNKLRVTTYKVIGEMAQELVEPLYKNDGSVYSLEDEDDDYYDDDDSELEDDFCDDDDNDDDCPETCSKCHFVPKFRKGDKIQHIQTRSVYTADSDSYMNSVGEEVVNINYQGYISDYDVKYYRKIV